MNKQKTISVLSIILASLAIINPFTVSYIKGGFQDTSLFYWYMPFLFLGAGISIFGIFFLILAIKSLHNTTAYKLTRYLLIIALIVLIILLTLSVIWGKQQNQKRQQDYATLDKIEDYIKSIHKINQINIPSNDKNGFILSIKTTGGIAGDYNLKINISSDKKTFLESSEIVTLPVSPKDVTKNINYNDLFKKCFNEFDKSDSYICVENTGAMSTMKVIVELSPVQNNIDANTGSLDSSKEMQFKLQTFTKEHQVNVNNFKLLDY